MKRWQEKYALEVVYGKPAKDVLSIIMRRGVIVMIMSKYLSMQVIAKQSGIKLLMGDLPKPENGNVIAIPVQACYTNETGIKVNGPCCFFFIDNTFRSLNIAKTLNVIAWTELPIYEGDKKEDKI